MKSWIYSLALAIVAGFGNNAADAATFTPSGTVEAGESTTVGVDLNTASLAGFDLFLNVPTALMLTLLADDSSDGAGGLVQRFGAFGLDAANRVVGAALDSGQTPDYDFTYAGTVPGAQGFLGVRVTNLGGNIAASDLTFLTNPAAAAGVQKVDYYLWEYGVGQAPAYSTGSFDVTITRANVVPLPAGAVLLITGLGAFGAARAGRRRRQ